MEGVKIADVIGISKRIESTGVGVVSSLNLWRCGELKAEACGHHGECRDHCPSLLSRHESPYSFLRGN